LERLRDLLSFFVFLVFDLLRLRLPFFSFFDFFLGVGVGETLLESRLSFFRPRLGDLVSSRARESRRSFFFPADRDRDRDSFRFIFFALLPERERDRDLDSFRFGFFPLLPERDRESFFERFLLRERLRDSFPRETERSFVRVRDRPRDRERELDDDLERLRDLDRLRDDLLDPDDTLYERLRLRLSSLWMLLLPSSTILSLMRFPATLVFCSFFIAL